MVESSDQELRREIEGLRREGFNRIATLEKSSAVDEVHRANVEKRLASIEDTLKWLVRLVFGSIIAAIIAFILQGGLNIG